LIGFGGLQKRAEGTELNGRSERAWLSESGADGSMSMLVIAASRGDGEKVDG
jgi:hypothetical protein